jgi:hypothetical protein
MSKPAPKISCAWAVGLPGSQLVIRKRPHNQLFAPLWREAAPSQPDGPTRKAYLALAKGYERLADLIEKEKSVETDYQPVNLSPPTDDRDFVIRSAIQNEPIRRKDAFATTARGSG